MHTYTTHGALALLMPFTLVKVSLQAGLPQEWKLHSFSWGCSERNLNDDCISICAGGVPDICQ